MSNNMLPEPLNQLSSDETSYRCLEAGETLFVHNGLTTGLFYLVTGVIDLTRSTEQGHNMIIHKARAGETFAEASLFSDVYHCTATAKVRCEVIQCERTSVLTMLRSNNEFMHRLMQRFATQLQDGRRRIELLSVRAADERVMMALVDGLLIGDIASFAETIGLAPETVYRSLAQLSKKGLITKTSRGHYQVSDVGGCA